MGISNPTAQRERMFAPPVGSDVDPTLVIGPNLAVAEWHTIIEALAKQEDSKSQHLCTSLRRAFTKAEPMRVFIAGQAEL
jgi:hypothetical protein